MKGLASFGERLTEFFVITILLALSAVTVLPFVPVWVGVTAFLGQHKDKRRWKDVFTTIGKNWKVLIPYTLFQLAILLFAVLNVYFFNTHPEQMNYFIYAVSYVALVVGLMIFVSAPTIIVYMNVTFRQLLSNSIMLMFGSLWRGLASVAVIFGVFMMVLYAPYYVILTLYVAPLLITNLMKENFYHLKAKALHTSVYELKKREVADDYTVEADGKKEISE